MFHDLLEFSGSEIKERDFDPDYTILDNAMLFAEFFGVSSSYLSERFDRNLIRTALLKSKLFAPNGIVSDLSDWHIHMAMGTHIGLMFLVIWFIGDSD